MTPLSSRGRSWSIALLFALVLCPVSCAEKELSRADKALLDGLFKDFLFDPTGAQYVRVQVMKRTVRATQEPVTEEGWLTAGPPARVHFPDGSSIPAPKPEDLRKIDFVADYRAKTEPDIVMAAWLHRLGHDDLAADCLARLGAPKAEMLSTLRQRFAWSNFADMVHAFMVSADDEALQHGETLLRLYPKEAAEEYPQSKAIVADLKRRQQKGTFGKTPPKTWPAGFDKWEPKRKVAYLIDALDEVGARQWGAPGGVDLTGDRPVKALIDLGDIAVPDLINTIEKDRRLTRSVHYWREYAEQRTVMAVREAALVAAMSIMQVQAFQTRTTGDDFTVRGEEMAVKTAARLRDYWKKYGGTPFDERMMKILTDPKAEPKSWREAAENLARGAPRRKLQSTIAYDFSSAHPVSNAAVAKFKNPTAAEAILAAMDRDLTAFDATKPERPREMHLDEEQLVGLQDFDRRQLEQAYLRALTVLGDKRIAPVLAKRSETATSPRMRRCWAVLCQELGEPVPFKAFAEDFRLGKIKLPVDKRPHDDFERSLTNAELRGMVHDLIAVDTPEADRALMALADASHPYHERVLLGTLNSRVDGHGVWFAHRVSIALLRGVFGDCTPTGATYGVGDDSIYRREKDGGVANFPSIPDFLQDPSARKSMAPERICDLAAEHLSTLILGMPPYHALCKDADARLKALKEAVDHYAYRPATPGESDTILGRSDYQVYFVPDIEPLNHPATADHVRKGKAIFELHGNGKPANVKLPLAGVLKGGKEVIERGQPPRKTGGLLIVQAETGPDGKVKYGVIMEHSISVVSAADVTDVKPVPVYYRLTFPAR